MKWFHILNDIFGIKYVTTRSMRVTKEYDEENEIAWHLEKMRESVISERDAWESRKMLESWKIWDLRLTLGF